MTTAVLEYDFYNINDSNIYRQYTNVVNIVFNKNNINNHINQLHNQLYQINNDIIVSRANMIVSCFQTFINHETQPTLNKTHYVLFDYYNMPLLRIVNSEDRAILYCAKFK